METRTIFRELAKKIPHLLIEELARFFAFKQFFFVLDSIVRNIFTLPRFVLLLIEKVRQVIPAILSAPQLKY